MSRSGWMHSRIGRLSGEIETVHGRFYGSLNKTVKNRVQLAPLHNRILTRDIIGLGLLVGRGAFISGKNCNMRQLVPTENRNEYWHFDFSQGTTVMRSAPIWLLIRRQVSLIFRMMETVTLTWLTKRIYKSRIWRRVRLFPFRTYRNSTSLQTLRSSSRLEMYRTHHTEFMSFQQSTYHKFQGGRFSSIAAQSEPIGFLTHSVGAERPWWRRDYRASTATV